MGLFSKLKAQVEAAQQAANAMAGVEPVSDIPEFVAPWPQEEVDRLLQGPGPIRAIVLKKQHQILQDGEHVGRMRVDLTVRVRGPEGTLYDPVKLKASVSSWVATLIEKGLDVPVERDPAYRRATKIDVEAAHRGAGPRARRRQTGSVPPGAPTRRSRAWAKRQRRSEMRSKARRNPSRRPRDRACPVVEVRAPASLETTIVAGRSSQLTGFRYAGRDLVPRSRGYSTCARPRAALVPRAPLRACPFQLSQRAA